MKMELSRKVLKIKNATTDIQDKFKKKVKYNPKLAKRNLKRRPKRNL